MFVMFWFNWRKTASCFRRAFSPAIDFNVCVHMFVYDRERRKCYKLCVENVFL